MIEVWPDKEPEKSAEAKIGEEYMARRIPVDKPFGGGVLSSGAVLSEIKLTTTCIIEVYLDNGNVHYYEVSTEAKAREHAAAIIKTGYRSVTKDDLKTITWFPPHAIVKVAVRLPYASTTKYTDSIKST